MKLPNFPSMDAPLQGFVCPNCHGELLASGTELSCKACEAMFTTSPHVDFLGGDDGSVEEYCETIVENEDRAMAFKAARFYEPELSRLGPLSEQRVLDDGCGTGRLVDELADLGVSAWGIDPVKGRFALWRQRAQRARLARADGLLLPFPDGFFDAVLSNGVLEHVGEFEPDKAQRRQDYVSEALRVLRPGGVLLLGHPNGACPIDFWHGGLHSMRFHRPYEGWMPAAPEVRRYVKRADPSASVEALSPRSYNSFERAARSRLGRALTPAARAVIWTVDKVPLLRTSPINPQLIFRITRS